MAKNKLVNPFLKWVGGKRQLLPVISDVIPRRFNTYYEPFVGGGALLFKLQPKNAVINDLNEELINVYTVIKKNVHELIEDLKIHENNPEYFYRIRSLDRDKNFKNLSPIKRASRIIYLNKTCYNGLFRVNNAGEFNSPFGSYKNPNIINESILKAVNKYLNNNDIQILNKDYADVFSKIKSGDFVYLDPPYYPVSQSSSFTGYIKGGFDANEQNRLKELCTSLNSKKVDFLLSNSATDYIRDLYKDFTIITVKANRFINSDGDKRGFVDELLIRNYE